MITTVNNTDLKQISKLLDDRLDNKLDEKLAPIQKTLTQHGKMLRSLKKDQSIMLEMLDGEQMKQSKKLKRVEDYLGITP